MNFFSLPTGNDSIETYEEEEGCYLSVGFEHTKNIKSKKGKNQKSEIELCIAVFILMNTM